MIFVFKMFFYDGNVPNIVTNLICLACVKMLSIIPGIIRRGVMCITTTGVAFILVHFTEGWLFFSQQRRKTGKGQKCQSGHGGDTKHPFEQCHCFH